MADSDQSASTTSTTTTTTTTTSTTNNNNNNNSNNNKNGNNIELKKGNVCKAYKDGRWWGGFLLSKVHNNHATIKWEVYGGQEHLKCEPINSEREFLKLIPLNKLKLTIK